MKRPTEQLKTLTTFVREPWKTRQPVRPLKAALNWIEHLEAENQAIRDEILTLQAARKQVLDFNYDDISTGATDTMQLDKG